MNTPRLRTVAISAVTALIMTGGCALPGNAQPAPDPNILFESDFNGPEGAPPGAPWEIDTGAGGWGNSEMQTYTAASNNVRLDGQGNLVISAEIAPNGAVSSARISTHDSFSFIYGRAEARISLPGGRGLHPAFWLLGSDVDQVGWPESGEIDVIETINDIPDYHTGVHAPADGTERGQEVSAGGPSPVPLFNEFHTYWVERTPNRIVTGIDDHVLLTVTPNELQGNARWVFDKPFHLLLNLAVGGNWPGPPDASTPNPATMLVDWVRVSKL